MDTPPAGSFPDRLHEPPAGVDPKPRTDATPGGGPDPAAGGRPADNPPRRRRALRVGVLTGVVLLLLAVGLLAAYRFLAGPFEARTLLKVERRTPTILFEDREQTRRDGADYEEYCRTQATLAKSRMVLNAALNEPELKDCKLVQVRPGLVQRLHDLVMARLGFVQGPSGPVEWLDDHVTADYSAGPGLLTISLRGNDPDDQVKVVNAIARVYLREIVAKEHNERFKMLDQLKEIQARFEDKVKGKRKALAELAEAAGADTGEHAALKQRLALEQLNRAQSELLDVRSEMRRLRVRALLNDKRGKAAGDPAVPDQLLEEELRKDPVAQNHLAREAELEAEIERATQADPRNGESRAQATRAELDAVRKALAERRKKLRPELEARVREKARAEAVAGRAEDQEKMAYYRELEKQLTEDIVSLSKDAKRPNGQGLGLEDLRKEIAQAERVLDRIATQTEALDVERNAPPRVRLLEEGVVKPK